MLSLDNTDDRRPLVSVPECLIYFTSRKTTALILRAAESAISVRLSFYSSPQHIHSVNAIEKQPVYSPEETCASHRLWVRLYELALAIAII